jgi:hypothetical protein
MFIVDDTTRLLLVFIHVHVLVPRHRMRPCRISVRSKPTLPQRRRGRAILVVGRGWHGRRAARSVPVPVRLRQPRRPLVLRVAISILPIGGCIWMRRRATRDQRTFPLLAIQRTFPVQALLRGASTRGCERLHADLFFRSYTSRVVALRTTARPDVRLRGLMDDKRRSWRIGLQGLSRATVSVVAVSSVLARNMCRLILRGRLK